MIGLAIRHLLGARFPLVNLHTLRITSFGASIGGLASLMLVIGGIPFLLPLLFQESYGWSPVDAGFMVLFLFVGNLGVKPATRFLFDRFGFRNVLVGATAGLLATALALAAITGGAPLPVIAAILLVSGSCRSVGMTGYSTMAFGDVSGEQLRHATTLQAMTQQLGLGLGVAGAAVALHVGQGWSGDGSGPGDKAGFSIAFLILAGLALFALWRAFRLDRQVGEVLRADRTEGGVGKVVIRLPQWRRGR